MTRNRITVGISRTRWAWNTSSLCLIGSLLLTSSWARAAEDPIKGLRDQLTTVVHYPQARPHDLNRGETVKAGRLLARVLKATGSAPTAVQEELGQWIQKAQEAASREVKNTPAPSGSHWQTYAVKKPSRRSANISFLADGYFAAQGARRPPQYSLSVHVQDQRAHQHLVKVTLRDPDGQTQVLKWRVDKMPRFNRKGR
jgi:hypothetical protein